MSWCSREPLRVTGEVTEWRHYHGTRADLHPGDLIKPAKDAADVRLHTATEDPKAALAESPVIPPTSLVGTDWVPTGDPYRVKANRQRVEALHGLNLR